MMVKGITTRSPGRKAMFSLPTSTTSPMNSWPMMSPDFMPGMKPSNKWRSEPQIAQADTFTIASRGCSMPGSGTRSQRMSCLPCQVSAFMVAPDALTLGLAGRHFRALQELGGHARHVFFQPGGHGDFFLQNLFADLSDGGLTQHGGGCDEVPVGGDFHVLERIAEHAALNHFVGRHRAAETLHRGHELARHGLLGRGVAAHLPASML